MCVGRVEFVALDFNEEGATVFAGSSNYAFGSTGGHGDSVIIVKDPNSAIQFAVEAFRTIDSCRSRAAAQRRRTKAPPLDPADRWVEPFFKPGTIQERRLLIGRSARGEMQVAETPKGKSTRSGPAASRTQKCSPGKKKKV